MIKKYVLVLIVWCLYIYPAESPKEQWGNFVLASERGLLISPLYVSI